MTAEFRHTYSDKGIRSSPILKRSFVNISEFHCTIVQVFMQGDCVLCFITVCVNSRSLRSRAPISPKARVARSLGREGNKLSILASHTPNIQRMPLPFHFPFHVLPPSEFHLFHFVRLRPSHNSDSLLWGESTFFLDPKWNHVL